MPDWEFTLSRRVREDNVVCACRWPRFIDFSELNGDSYAAVGKPAIIALRHLRTHGTLTFGTFAPTLPPGLSLDRTSWAYNAGLEEGLVTRQDNYPKQGDLTYRIAPTMGPILAELLYQPDEPQQT